MPLPLRRASACALLLGLAPLAPQAATFLVTTNADSGPGSLREAIQLANQTSETDVINFAIGTGTVEIVLQSALPTITQRLKIEGFSQPPVDSTVPRVRLVGSQVPGGQGLRLNAPACVGTTCSVRGLQIVEFPLEGVLIERGLWTLRGNYIGTDGTTARGNTRDGIAVYAEQATIGGSGANEGNVISGNGYSGLALHSTGTVVEGNRIGTNAAGSVAVPNANIGIRLYSGYNQIGGYNAGSANLISGNARDGIVVEEEAGENVIVGNRIGTRANGNFALPNGGNGVAIYGPRTVLGLAGVGNLISGNAYNGVAIGGAASGSVLFNNRIGTNAAGTGAIPNTSGGIRVFPTSGVDIGGDAAGDGNLISGNLSSQLYIDAGASAIRVLGNRIGTTADGNAALGAGAGGMGLGGEDLQIGAAGAGNLISGNEYGGIAVFDPGARDIRIQGNRIGTRADGLVPLGNGSYGIRGILGRDVLIGGSGAGEGNLVSGNERGISIEDGMVDTRVQGNIIGLDANQTTRLGNSDWSGLDVSGPGTIVGGSTPGAGNVIAGQQDSGIVLYGSAKPGPIVQGNYIGTTAAGVAGLGNGLAGVQLYAADNALVGGTGAGEGNLIAHNAFNGIFVRWGSRNRFIGNRIRDNGLLGIEVSPQGPSANDVLDADGGPNNGQNHPVITSALAQDGNVAITGRLQSAPLQSYLIEFNHSPQCDPSGLGQGAQPIGFTTVVTDAAGNADFALTLPLATGQGVLTSIATAIQDASSEYSPCHALDGPNPGRFQLWRDAFVAYEGLPFVEVAIVRSHGNQGAASVQFDTTNGSAVAPADYGAVSQRIDFADGETIRLVRIPIVTDNLTEGQEQFQIALSAPLGGATLGARSVAPGIIIDVGPDFPFYGIDDQAVEAPASGTRTMTFNVFLSPTDIAQTISYATVDATAKAGQDYVATSGTLEFPASSQTQTRTLTVEVLPNLPGEGDESFLVDVSAEGNIAVYAGYGTGVIRAAPGSAAKVFGDGFED